MSPQVNQIWGLLKQSVGAVGVRYRPCNQCKKMLIQNLYNWLIDIRPYTLRIVLAHLIDYRPYTHVEKCTRPEEGVGCRVDLQSFSIMYISISYYNLKNFYRLFGKKPYTLHPFSRPA
jgi:hypothetical protein